MNLTRVDIPLLNEDMMGTKMAESINEHIDVEDWSLTLPFKSLYGFFLMLISLWFICLWIGIGFQIQYAWKHRNNKR